MTAGHVYFLPLRVPTLCITASLLTRICRCPILTHRGWILPNDKRNNEDGKKSLHYGCSNRIPMIVYIFLVALARCVNYSGSGISVYWDQSSKGLYCPSPKFPYGLSMFVWNLWICMISFWCFHLQLIPISHPKTLRPEMVYQEATLAAPSHPRSSCTSPGGSEVPSTTGRSLNSACG